MSSWVSHLPPEVITCDPAIIDRTVSCLSAGSVVLDLMSSWVSHLPPEVKYEKVLGHGLNAPLFVHVLQAVWCLT
jgi:hypothetical protein